MAARPEQQRGARYAYPRCRPAPAPLAEFFCCAIGKPAPEGHQKDICDERSRTPKACFWHCDATNLHQVDEKPCKENVDRVYQAKMADHEPPNGRGREDPEPRHIRS